MVQEVRKLPTDVMQHILGWNPYNKFTVEWHESFGEDREIRVYKKMKS